MTEDPKRLLDAGPDDLRAMLSAARSDVPDAAQMAALALKLGAIVGGGVAGGGAAGGGAAAVATKSAAVGVSKGLAAGIVAKVTAAVVVTAVAATSAVYVVRERQAPRAAPSGMVAAAPATVTATATATATATPTPMPDPIPTVAVAPSASPTPMPSVRATTESPDAEVKLLDDALAAVRTSPERALVLCSEHARRFPSGAFVQEREVIAIEALVKLGRHAEAERRAQRFAASYPGSSHLRRVESLVGGE